MLRGTSSQEGAVAVIAKTCDRDAQQGRRCRAFRAPGSYRVHHELVEHDTAEPRRTVSRASLSVEGQIAHIAFCLSMWRPCARRQLIDLRDPLLPRRGRGNVGRSAL